MPMTGSACAAAVAVDQVGDTLVLRTDADPGQPLRAMAATLPVESSRTAILSAPSVTGLPEYFDVLADVATEHLRGGVAGIRLFALGISGDWRVIESGARGLADRMGLEVAAPLGPVTVSAGGASAVAALSGSAAGWVICPPGAPPRYEPPWYPARDWVRNLHAVFEWAAGDGRLSVQAVPAGLWVRPAGVAAEHSGPAVDRAPDPNLVTVIVGGGAEPVPTDTEIHRLLAILPEPGRHQVAHVPAPADPVPPGTPTAAGWCLTPAPSSVGTLPAMAGYVVEVNLGPSTFLVDDREVPAAALAHLLRHRSNWAGQPVLILVPGDPRRIPGAGGLLGELARELGAPVLASAGAVSVTVTGMLTTVASFLCWYPAGGPARDLGRVLPVPATSRPPAVLPPPVRAVGTARVPTAPDAPRPAPPAQAVPAPADSAHPDEPVPVPVDPELAATFAVGRWARPAGPARVVDPPATLSTVEPAELAPEPASVVQATEPIAPDPAASRPAALTPEPVAPAAEPVRQLVPLWVREASCDTADRGRLYEVLNGRYDAHARLVTKTLAEQPGLRGAGLAAQAQLVTGLVAVRAYCTNERDAVNDALRGAGSGADRIQVLAGCALHGLRRLPTVLGPVFRDGRVDPVLVDRYQPGDELIEPGFLDVDLAGPGDPEATVHYVIWSVSAHRLDRVLPDSTAALFPAGSRFGVLAVDRDAGPTRVLLRELAGSAGTRVEQRLRDARRPAGAATGTPIGLWTAPVGLDERGQPFAPPATAGAALPDDEGGRA